MVRRVSAVLRVVSSKTTGPATSRTAACGERWLRGWSIIVLTLDRRLYDGDVAPPGPSLLFY